MQRGTAARQCYNAAAARVGKRDSPFHDRTRVTAHMANCLSIRRPDKGTTRCCALLRPCAEEVAREVYAETARKAAAQAGAVKLAAGLTLGAALGSGSDEEEEEEHGEAGANGADGGKGKGGRKGKGKAGGASLLGLGYGSDEEQEGEQEEAEREGGGGEQGEKKVEDEAKAEEGAERGVGKEQRQADAKQEQDAKEADGSKEVDEDGGDRAGRAESKAASQRVRDGVPDSQQVSVERRAGPAQKGVWGAEAGVCRTHGTTHGISTRPWHTGSKDLGVGGYLRGGWEFVALVECLAARHAAFLAAAVG